MKRNQNAVESLEIESKNNVTTEAYDDEGLPIVDEPDESDQPKAEKPVLLLLAPEGSTLDDSRIQSFSEGFLLDKLIGARQVAYSLITVSIKELQLIVTDPQTLWPYATIKMLENAPGGRYSSLFFLYGRQLETILPEVLFQELIQNQSIADQERSSYDSVFNELEKNALFQDQRARFGASLDEE